MITQEVEDRIVLKVIERILTLMPEVVGNLMANHASNAKIKDDFYSKHPKFKDHTDVVREVVAKIEGAKLGQNYEDILNGAIPEIESQIKLKTTLNTQDVLPKSEVPRVLSEGSPFGEL